MTTGTSLTADWAYCAERLEGLREPCHFFCGDGKRPCSCGAEHREKTCPICHGEEMERAAKPDMVLLRAAMLKAGLEHEAVTSPLSRTGRPFGHAFFRGVCADLLWGPDDLATCVAAARKALDEKP